MSVVSAGAPLELESRFYAAALLRESLASWTVTMLPYFKKRAQEHWGIKTWESECSSLLSDDMKKHVETDGWDTYRIAAVIAKRAEIFLPNYDKLEDSKRELYRQVSEV
jgi:hypothetical protein